MTPPNGDDRGPEPTITYATPVPSSDPGGQEPGEKVPVFLIPDPQEFERTLLAYGLIDADELVTFLDEFPGGRPQEAVVLARALVQAGVLSRYQASAVLQGKAKVLAIGPYVVLDRLGSGGMGLVFQARHRESGDVVALKLLPPSASKQEDSVLRFQREARIMAQLDHANIVSSRAIGEHNGVHYLVMDHVQGRDLHRMVRADGPLPVRQAVDCMIQAAKGLDVAHGRGIVHRDIKPANIMVDLTGTVRVLDLGLARITHAADPLQAREADPSITHSGMIVGTVDFLPPEQSNNAKLADKRSDVYALGCTLYYLLTGRSPFEGVTVMERLIAHHQKPVPWLRDLRKDVPPGLDAAFRRMLEKDPDRRPQSMVEVIQALETVFSDNQITEVFPEVDRRAFLGAGRVSPDRTPDSSHLSGYEVLGDGRSDLRESEILSESESKIWSPLLNPPSRECPIVIDRTPHKSKSSLSLSVKPATQRRWVGTMLVGLLLLGGVLALIAIARAIALYYRPEGA